MLMIYVCVALLIDGVLTLVNGFTLTFMWKWFVVPFGMQSISIWHAAGLICLLQMILARIPTKEQQEKNKLQIILENVTYTLIYNVYAMIVAFIIHALM